MGRRGHRMSALTLIERIRRGEAAIERARAKGRDVKEWEAHLGKLKREAHADSNDDPVLSPEQWYPPFREFHHNVTRQTPDFDYGQLRTRNPDLYQRINAKENEIDELGAARLSEVMVIMREWRRLVLAAEFEQQETRRRNV